MLRSGHSVQADWVQGGQQPSARRSPFNDPLTGGPTSGHTSRSEITGLTSGAFAFNGLTRDRQPILDKANPFNVVHKSPHRAIPHLEQSTPPLKNGAVALLKATLSFTRPDHGGNLAFAQSLSRSFAPQVVVTGEGPSQPNMPPRTGDANLVPMGG